MNTLNSVSKNSGAKHHLPEIRNVEASTNVGDYRV